MTNANRIRELIHGWRLAQVPPWSVKYMATRLGVSPQWMSKIGCAKNIRPSAELAYKIEVLTGGKIRMVDILLGDEDRKAIKEEVSRAA